MYINSVPRQDIWKKKEKPSKSLNRKIPKNKTRKKRKHIYNSNTNPKQKIITTQIEKKNILTRNDYEKIGTHGQHKIQEFWGM